MDENKYILKTISTKCILIYIALTLVAVPIIYMTILKITNTEGNNYLLQSIITLVSYLGLAITFCIMLRKYLFDDVKDLKNKWWFKLLLVIGLVAAIKLLELFCGWFYSLFGETINGNNQDAVVNTIKENAVLMAFSTCIFAPIVEEISNSGVKCGKMDIDKNIELAMKYGIEVIPYVMIFKNGVAVDKSIGFATKNEIEKLINKNK